MEAELAAVSAVIESASLPFDSRRTALWCLGHLRAALERFSQTYESRYADEVNRLEQGLLAPLDASDAVAAGTARERLADIHERLGLAALRPAKKRSA